MEAFIIHTWRRPDSNRCPEKETINEFNYRFTTDLSICSVMGDRLVIRSPSTTCIFLVRLNCPECKKTYFKLRTNRVSVSYCYVLPGTICILVKECLGLVVHRSSKMSHLCCRVVTTSWVQRLRINFFLYLSRENRSKHCCTFCHTVNFRFAVYFFHVFKEATLNPLPVHLPITILSKTFRPHIKLRRFYNHFFFN